MKDEGIAYGLLICMVAGIYLEEEGGSSNHDAFSCLVASHVGMDLQLSIHRAVPAETKAEAAN
jgi:hypothetical protein